MIDDELRALMSETRAMIERGELIPAKVDWFWECRREHELTPDYLGRVLEDMGLTEMAKRARAAHYDDFHAPADVADGLEMLRLVRDLRRAARADTGHSGRPYSPEARRLRGEQIAAVENAVRRGEFDATKAESDRWAASKDGQATFAMLTAGRNDPCPCGSGRKFKRCHGA